MSTKKKLGSDLPPDVVDQFNEWCDSNTLNKGGAAVRALTLIQLLPMRIRNALMSGKSEMVREALLRAEAAIPEESPERISVEAITQALRPAVPSRQRKKG